MNQTTMNQNQSLVKVDTDKPPSLLLRVLGFILVILTWTVATVLLSVNATLEGFNITTTFVAMATGYFFGTFASSMLRSDSSVKTFSKSQANIVGCTCHCFFKNTLFYIMGTLGFGLRDADE